MFNVQYIVTLPDHNFAKAPQHKLIPDVHAGQVILEIQNVLDTQNQNILPSKVKAQLV